MTATARKLSEENLHERIALDGPDDELKELADTFDAMLARLEAAFESQKRFVANASHELRTPLSIIRTEVDVALANPDASTRRTCAAWARSSAGPRNAPSALIDGLLVLARSDRGPAALAPVDLAGAGRGGRSPVGGGSEGRRGGDAGASSSPPRPAATPPCSAGWPGNLIENAIRHNESGGRLEVVTGPAPDAAEVRLAVANSGPVIDAADVDGLFEPFRRLGADRGWDGRARGAGLGLSIVRSVAAAHGGRIDGPTPARRGADGRDLPAPTGADPRREPFAPFSDIAPGKDFQRNGFSTSFLRGQRHAYLPHFIAGFGGLRSGAGADGGSRGVERSVVQGSVVAGQDRRRSGLDPHDRRRDPHRDRRHRRRPRTRGPGRQDRRVDELRRRRTVTRPSAQGSAQDDQGHGTHVSGIAAACEGQRQRRRRCGSRRPAGRGQGPQRPGHRVEASDVTAGIKWVVDHGAKIVNLSLGDPAQPITALISENELKEGVELRLEQGRHPGHRLR